MKRVLTALVLIPLILTIVFEGPLWLTAFVAALFGLAATVEYLNIAELHGYALQRKSVLVLQLALFVSLIATGIGYESHMRGAAGRTEIDPVRLLASWLFIIPVFAGTFCFLAWALRESELRSSLPSAALSGLALFYIGVPFAALVLTYSNGGPYLLLFLFVVVWSGDIAAYYIGRRFGRHKLAPRISPNKSWEGAAASVVMAVGLGLWLHFNRESVVSSLEIWLPFDKAFRHTTSSGPWWLAAAAALVANAAAQLGDLAESALKRGAGVKDSGTLLPGHGGVLDRIDALLFAAPVIWAYSTIKDTVEAMHR